jgi:hypothetical protein
VILRARNGSYGRVDEVESLVPDFTVRGRVRLRDFWWLIVAVAFATLLIGNLVAFVVVAVRGPRRYLVLILVPFVADYWIMLGAWLRTAWGRPPPGAVAPAGPPVLSVTRARTLILIAAACALAVGVALALQLYWAR